MPNCLSAKDKKFYFHIRLLEDMKVVEKDDERYILKLPSGTVEPPKLRLTASGYDYLEALTK